MSISTARLLSELVNTRLSVFGVLPSRPSDFCVKPPLADTSAAFSAAASAGLLLAVADGAGVGVAELDVAADEPHAARSNRAGTASARVRERGLRVMRYLLGGWTMSAVAASYRALAIRGAQRG